MALTSTEEAQLRALIAQQAALLSLAGNETTITSKLSATKVNLGQIAAASALADTDLTLVRQGAADKSSSLTVLKTWITNSMAAIATASGFAALLAASGYVKFPSWLGAWIVQWGAFTNTGGGSNSITYPIAFPASSYSISAQKSDTAWATAVLIGPSSTSGFTAYFVTSASAALDSTTSRSASYIAIGK